MSRNDSASPSRCVMKSRPRSVATRLPPEPSTGETRYKRGSGSDIESVLGDQRWYWIRRSANRMFLHGATIP